MIITKEINSSKLLDELLADELVTPLRPNGTSVLQGNDLYVSEDADIEAIELIIEAHDPTPLPMPKTDAEKIADLEAENLMNMLALAELHGMILASGGGSE